MKELIKERQTIITTAVWLALSVAFLGIYESDVVYNLHLGSFYCNAEYYTEKVAGEDGLLMLWARYLSQFFIFPFWASLCLCAVLATISVCLARIADIKPKDIASAFFPASLAVLAIGIVGSHLHNDIRDVLVMPTLSLAYITLSAGIAKTIKNDIITYIATAALGIIGFRIGGLTGLFAMAAIALVAGKKDKKTLAVSASITVVVSAIMIWIQNDVRHWITPLTHYEYTGIFVVETLMYLSILKVLIAQDLIRKYMPNYGEKTKAMKNYIALATMALGVFFFSERHSAFRGECRLTRLMVEEDFKGIVKAADEIKEPNWPCYGLRLIGLDQTNQMESRLFRYTCEKSGFPIAYEFHYPWMLLYSGQPLMSLTYAMDYHLFKEENYLNMMVMAYDYILINEKLAAEKILSKIEDNIVYRDWVRKVRRHYGTHLEFAQKNPNFRKAMQGAFTENLVIGQVPFENTFRLTNHPNNTNLSRRLLTSLFKKDLEDFKRIMMNITRNNKAELPLVYQEAICVCSAEGDNRLLESIPIRPEIGRKTNEILKMIQKGADYEQVRKKFGDSYLTYYFFAVKPER